MVHRPDRFMVSAALAALASGAEEEWQKHALCVLEFVKHTPHADSSFTERSRVRFSGGDENVTGYVEGMGDAVYKARSKDTHEHMCTTPYERIGHYRVFNHLHQWSIRFEHFRQSGTFRRHDGDELSGGFAISFDQHLEPLAFSEVLLVKTRPPLWLQLKFFLEDITDHIRERIRHLMSEERHKQLVLVNYRIRLEYKFKVIHSVLPQYLPGDVLFRNIHSRHQK